MTRLARHVSPKICLAFAIVAASPAFALDAKSEQGATGVWRLSQGAGRECTIQLRSEAHAGGHAVGMPPGCRHAMPGLAKVAGWKLPGAGSNRIARQGRRGRARLRVRQWRTEREGPEGRILCAHRRQRGAQARAATQTQPAAPRGPSVPAAEMPGRYSVLRDGNKDTGCMLTLQPGGRAQLAPACRDNGITVFDPVAWSYAGGKLMLRARKGHHANFEYEQDQSWQKDPKEGGKKLGFRKM